MRRCERHVAAELRCIDTMLFRLPVPHARNAVETIGDDARWFAVPGRFHGDTTH